MKKLLAMVLALVMTLSLAVSANAFKDDKSISDDYAESVAVLNGMGVFKGYEDGSFKPEGNITRAEVATIVYRIYTADVAKNDKSGLYATYNKFSDMAGAGWAQGYIGYCANASLVKGYPDGTFKPSGKVTGYEVLAMILRAVGYDKNNEFSGADWALHVAQTAQQLGVLDRVAKTTDLNAPASRELVAELLFQGIQKAQVTYTPAFGYVTDKVIGTKTNSLGEKNFKLASAAASDKWGRPATKWTYNTGDKATTFVEKPNLTYTKAVTECDVAHDAGLKVDTAYTLYVNGQKQATTYTVNLTDTVTKMGAQGRLVEVYDNTIVMIDTFLAKVTYVAPAAYDAQGHLRTEATIKLDVYATKGSTAATPLTLTNGEDAYPYAVGDYVLLNSYTNAANSATESGSIKTGADKYGEVVSKATSIDGAQSVIYYNAKQHNVEGTVYDDAVKFYFDNAVASTNKFTWFFDQYNNLIGNVEIAAATSYGVINSIWWAGNATDGSGVAKANVTYMDGTTALVDLSKMTYVHTDTTTTPATESVVTGTVTHSTGNQNKVMSVGTVGTKSFFFVDSYINTNAVKDVDGILNDNLFQFTTQANGTLAAVEVATLVPSGNKLFNENLFVSKNTQYNGGNLIVDDATVFLVRNNTADPYTFKSIVGLGNIDNYAKAEVDFVDLNGDKVADYVYVIADPVASKVTSLFYYANEQISYDAKTGVYTIPGYVDGVKGNIYADEKDLAVVNLLTDLRSQVTRNVAGGIFVVALSNNYVKNYSSITELGYESSNAVTAFAGYPMAAAYTGYTVKVDSIKGAEKDTYKNSVYTDYVDGTITNDKFYTVSGNGVDGLTKMPLALGDVTTQNVIVVYNADPAGTSATLNRLALQVYAVNKVDTSVNPDPAAVGTVTLKLNIVDNKSGAILQSYSKTVSNVADGTHTITLAEMAALFNVSTVKLTAFGPDSAAYTLASTATPAVTTASVTLSAYYAD